MRRKVTINVGDTVCYRIAFLRDICMLHTDMSHARGTVTEIKRIGSKSSPLELARVEWDCDMPIRVNVQNLALRGTLAATSEDR